MTDLSQIKCPDKSCPRYGLENVCFTNLVLFCNIRRERENYSQHNTPTTTKEGEDKRGKIVKGFPENHLSDNTSGADNTQQYNCNSGTSELTCNRGSVEAGVRSSASTPAYTQQHKTSFVLEDKAKVDASIILGGKTVEAGGERLGFVQSEIGKLLDEIDTVSSNNDFLADSPPAYVPWGCRIKGYEERKE